MKNIFYGEVEQKYCKAWKIFILCYYRILFSILYRREACYQCVHEYVAFLLEVDMSRMNPYWNVSKATGFYISHCE